MNVEKMKVALEYILKTAMDHPCFDADLFERRDIDAICREGGDTATWIIVAIEADNALKG